MTAFRKFCHCFIIVSTILCTSTSRAQNLTANNATTETSNTTIASIATTVPTSKASIVTTVPPTSRAFTSTTATPNATTESFVQIVIDTLSLNKEKAKYFFGPLFKAIQPYLTNGGDSDVADSVRDKVLDLVLFQFPKLLEAPPFHELVDKFVARLGDVNMTNVDPKNTTGLLKTIGAQLAWDGFLGDIYGIGHKYKLITSPATIQQTIELKLLDFTFGALPPYLNNPLVWDVRDLFMYQLSLVNFTGVDKSDLGAVFGAIGLQVDFDFILNGFYEKLKGYGLYPAQPTIPFIVKTILLNFTFHTLPHLLRHPIFQAADKIVMEQFSKVDLTGADPSNIGKLIMSIIAQMQLAEVFAKINAIPGVQDPNKQVLPVSNKCSLDTKYLVDSMLIGKSWALTMLDALGKPGDGILKGNLYMTGSYDQCTAAVGMDETIIQIGNKTGVHETERFNARFCKVTIDLPQSFIDGLGVDTRGVPVRLSWGLCVPDTCGGSDLKGLLTSGVMSRIDINFREVYCRDAPKLAEDGSAITAIVILSFLGLLAVIGTLLDIHGQSVRSPQSTTNGHTPTENGAASEKSPVNGGYVADEPSKDFYALTPVHVGETELGENGTVGQDCAENGKVAKTTVEEKEPVHHERPKRESVAVKMLVSFSVVSNVPKILAAKHAKGSITCLNGIRYLSMAWVILCHTYYYGVFSVSDNQTTENLIDANTFIQRFTMEPLVNGTFSVDTFFVLSGLLVSYLFFKDLDKRKGQINCVKMVIFYVHRFWRLTPIYMIVLMIFSCLYPYVIYGPLAPREMSIAENCKENWWTNLLYVSNLVRVDDMCMGWTWYLSNDMQFYIISPIFILTLYFWPVIGVILTTLLIGAHITSSAIIENRGAGNMLSINDVQPGKPSYYNDLYVKPYCRVGAYAIGLLLGKILHKRGNNKSGKFAATIGWIVALAAGLFITYCSYTELKEGAEPWSQDIRTAYESVSRIIFASCVAWVIYACHTGRGGYINSILSWQGLIPMARLTYAAYLIHPVIMFFYMYSRRTLIYLTDYSMIYFYLGHMCLAYGAAFILSVLFESPFLGLEKIVLKLLGK